MQNVLIVLVAVVAVALGAWWLISESKSEGIMNFHQVHQKLVDAIGGEVALNSVNTIRSFAHATSPNGDYTLEVLSARGGKARVTFANPDDTSTILHANGDQAWMLDPEANPVALENVDHAFILGHEFQMMILELDIRFSDPTYGGMQPFMEQDAVHFSASGEPDELPYDLYFDPATGLMQGMRFPDFLRNQESTVTVHFAEWCWINDVQLPCKVIATDEGGEFVLTFNDIEINTVDIALLDAPEGV